MGCCGSSENNSVSPQPHKLAFSASDILIQVDTPLEDNDSNNNKDLIELSPAFRKRKKVNQPDPPKEIEIVNKIPLNGHTQNIDLCSWNPTSDLLVTAATDRQLFLWDLQQSSEAPEPKTLSLVSQSDSASCMDWSDDGRFLAIGTERGYVVLFTSSGGRLAHWQPHEHTTKAVQINGDLVLSAGDIVCLYMISRKKWFRTAWNEAALTDVEWISTKQYLVADFYGTITLDTVEEKLFTELNFDFDIPADVPEHQYRSHTGGIYKLAKHPTRPKMFASCSVDCTIKIWSVDSHSPLQTLQGHFGFVMDIEWVGSSDSDLLVSGSFDGTVRIWDTRTGECRHQLAEHRDHVTKIDVTSDGRFIASAGHDGNVNLWGVDSGNLINTYEGPGRMLQVGFNVSGSFVVATSYGIAEILRLKYNRSSGRSSRKRKM